VGTVSVPPHDGRHRTNQYRQRRAAGAARHVIAHAQMIERQQHLE
jgi:hypothetical protein